MMWAPVLTPHGLLTLSQTDEPLALDVARGSRLEKAFARGPGMDCWSWAPTRLERPCLRCCRTGASSRLVT